MSNENETYTDLLNLLDCGEKGEMSVTFYLITHVKEDKKYNSIEFDMDAKFKDWLIENIKGDISLKKSNDDNNNHKNDARVVRYSHEFSINDSVAELDLEDPSYSDIKDTNNLIISSISNAEKNKSIHKSNFQAVKIANENKSCIVCYYKGIRKPGTRKRFLSLIKGEIKEELDGFLDIGGDVSFIIFKDSIFIFKARDFERAYKYESHITTKRDENIEKIIELGIFYDNDSEECFRNSSKNHLYARGIAEMDDDRLKDLKNNYGERCSDLKVIKNKLDLDPNIESKLRDEIGILVDLLKFFDFKKGNEITIKKDMNITPVLHFLQDKIVESYLTKKIKTIIGYEKD